MSQHDLSIANQGFPAFRSDLNDALQALGSMQSGTSAPSTTYANMLWYDTTNNIVKMRNEDNDAWISLFTLDQSGDLVSALYAASVTVGDGSASAPSITNDGDTNTGVYFPAADKIALATGGTQAVIVDASQNVGIGTSSPTTKLQVVGTAANTAVSVKDTTGYAILAAQNTGNNFYVGSDSSGGALTGSAYAAMLYASGAVNMTFATNATERMRIDSSGNLLVGQTSAGVVNGLGTSIEASGYDASRITVNHSSSGSSNGSFYMRFAYGGNVAGTISQSSTTNVAYNTSSDYRLKDNIIPMVGALAKVAQLKPCTYTWKTDGSDGQGFIAHELAEIVPDCVTGAKDAVETYTDEEGNEQTRPVYQGIDTSFLVATLTAAIQELAAASVEQQALITTLTERITALEQA